MPLPPPVNKPLLLVFPLAHTVNYERCLVVAQHLRPLFDIRFLHTDGQASLVYQHGFETFSNGYFTPHIARLGSILSEPSETNLELQFLEQVEILETLQPSLVISDGNATLSMAAEFTGVPLISIISGYQSIYYANERTSPIHLKPDERFQSIRDKYGLRQKHLFSEELEGDLNWICDLPEFYPQKELPFNYELIGPLFEIQKFSTAPQFCTLNPLKKTILIDINEQKLINALGLLNVLNNKQYNLVAEPTKSNLALARQSRPIQLVNIAQALSKTDLLLCDTERLMYIALHYGIPVLFTNMYTAPDNLIEALEQQQVGSIWKPDNAEEGNSILEYWLNKKHSDAYRTIPYKIKSATAAIEYKLLHSLLLHFPFLERKAVSFT
jgi:hypothetical protein